MSDITVTGSGASVVPANSATVKASGTSGAAITAGQSVYLDPSTLTIKPAKADSASSTNPPNIVGVALDTAPGAGQPISYATSGDVIYNAAFTTGQVYVVSAGSAGGIAPYSVLVATNFVAFLGVALSTTILRLGLIPASVQK